MAMSSGLGSTVFVLASGQPALRPSPTKSPSTKLGEKEFNNTRSSRWTSCCGLDRLWTLKRRQSRHGVDDDSRSPYPHNLPIELQNSGRSSDNRPSIASVTSDYFVRLNRRFRRWQDQTSLRRAVSGFRSREAPSIGASDDKGQYELLDRAREDFSELGP